MHDLKVEFMAAVLFVIAASEASHSHRGKNLAHLLMHSYEKLHHMKSEVELTTENALKDTQSVRKYVREMAVVPASAVSSNVASTSTAAPKKPFAMGAFELFNKKLTSKPRFSFTTIKPFNAFVKPIHQNY